MRSIAVILLALILTSTVAVHGNAQSSGPYVSTTVTAVSVSIGETVTATVALHNVPAEGYISAELTCTYNSTLVQVSNIADAGLFGSDPAVAINDPQNGSFIVAIAGSNGNKATTDGSAFTFNARGLQSGQAALDCTARVSRGDNILTDLPSAGAASLTIIDNATITPTPTGSTEPTSTFTETPTPTGSIEPTFTETPTETESLTPTVTSTFTETLTPSITSMPTDTATPSSTATASPTPTEQPPGTLSGRVIACKTVTVYLLDAEPKVVGSVDANLEGTFSITVPAGEYVVEADAEGFLNARAGTIDPAAGTVDPVVVIPSGGTTTMQTITLLAGDIFKVDFLLPGVIDEWDAMSIGMNYGKAEPPAADLNCDGIIDVLDLERLAANYRKTGPTPWKVSPP